MVGSHSVEPGVGRVRVYHVVSARMLEKPELVAWLASQRHFHALRKCEAFARRTPSLRWRCASWFTPLDIASGYIEVTFPELPTWLSFALERPFLFMVAFGTSTAAVD